MKNTEKLILVVEDDPVLQMVLVKQLSRLGFVAHVAADGAQAVVLSEKIPYALILMDIQMPRMDGIAATRAIRQREKLAGVHKPIVALTATTDKATCLDAGMNDFLHKPITAGQLKEVIERFIAPLSSSGRLS